MFMLPTHHCAAARAVCSLRVGHADASPLFSRLAPFVRCACLLRDYERVKQMKLNDMIALGRAGCFVCVCCVVCVCVCCVVCCVCVVCCACVRACVRACVGGLLFLLLVEEGRQHTPRRAGDTPAAAVKPPPLV